MDAARKRGNIRIRPGRCDCGAQHFTGRELEVLLEIAVGKTSQAAASALDIKPDTVNEHIGNMHAKAGVHKRAELITMTIVQGVVVFEDGVVRWGGRACVRPRASGLVHEESGRSVREDNGRPRPAAPT